MEQSQLLKKFKNEGLESYRSIVRFYEVNKSEIDQLEFDEYFSVFTEYVDALYEIGAHHKFIKLADEIIELSIIHNIAFFEGKDVFQYFIYKKANALMNLGLLDQAERVGFELLKLEPNHSDYIKLLQSIHYRRRSVSRINMRMMGVLFIFISALLIPFDLFIFPLMGIEVPLLKLIHLSLFMIGLGYIASAELSSYLFSKRRIREKLQSLKGDN